MNWESNSMFSGLLTIRCIFQGSCTQISGADLDAEYPAWSSVMHGFGGWSDAGSDIHGSLHVITNIPYHILRLLAQIQSKVNFSHLRKTFRDVQAKSLPKFPIIHCECWPSSDHTTFEHLRKTFPLVQAASLPKFHILHLECWPEFRACHFWSLSTFHYQNSPSCPESTGPHWVESASTTWKGSVVSWLL